MGISNLLKELSVVMAKDGFRTSESMCTANGIPWSFNVIKRCILQRLNEPLYDIETHSRGYGLQVDFCKGRNGRISGFFKGRVW